MHIKPKGLPGLLVLAGLIFVIIFISREPISNAYQAASANSKKIVPIYSVERPDNKISISFDATWGCTDTDKILNILKANKIKATFFLCGYWIDQFPDKVKKIAAEGHDIGNHGNTHAHGAQLSLEQNKQEIQKAHDKIKSLINIDMNLFRAPYGEYNNTVMHAAQELNYYVIQWDVDSLDWKELGAQHELNYVLNHKKLKNGSIILFHNGAKYTAQVLDQIIKSLQEKNYELVPISELIYKSDYHIDGDGRQIKN